jgi:hypothetical protein
MIPTAETYILGLRLSPPIAGGLSRRDSLVSSADKVIFARGYMRRIARAWIAAIATIFISAPFAKAQGPKIAQVKNTSGQVTIVRDGGNVTAKVGDFLCKKDVIQTGADGAIGVTFTDNTVMSTGPNSEVSLDEYRFDSSNFNGAMLTDMRKGTLAMVSGDIARSTPGAMKVKTPTAILGVRGTRFAVQVEGER